MSRCPVLPRALQVIALGLLVLVLPALVSAGTICGAVRDAATHGPIEGAGVFVRHPAGAYTGLCAATDETGAFCVTSIPAGTYDLEVRRDDYLVGYRRNVTVVDDVTGIDVIVDGPTGLRSPFPNPAIADVTLAFRLAQPGPTRLAVYDLRGRLVQGWESSTIAAGEHSQRWSLLDRDGRRVAPGLYFVRLTAGAVIQTRMFVYLPK
jgi:hypothetical protein